MITSSPLLLHLTNADSMRECGAKAMNLARLMRLGHPVPPGMVVTDGAFKRHLLNAGLGEACRELLFELSTLEPCEIRSRSAIIREKILNTPLDPALRSLLEVSYGREWSGKQLAVRSSASCEDGHAASFAGQLDSVLDVASCPQLEDAVRKVWASIWSERCLMYTRHNRIAEMRMGVVLHEQVNARFSGVLFTRDPLTGSQSGRAVIEYTSGLGARLAAGEVTPNRVYVRYSDLAVIRDSTEFEFPAGQELPTAMLAELGRLGLELERQFDAPQDVEWSVDGENVVILLQVRPITPTGADLRRDVWSNANIAENFPDCVSPFLYSVVSEGYTAYFSNLGSAFGISQWRLDAMSDTLANIVGLHAGRLYYNLSNIHTTIHLMPGGSLLARWFNQFTGAREFPAVNYPSGRPLGRAVEFLRVVIKTVWQYLWIYQRISSFEQTVERYTEATHPTRLVTRELTELTNDLRGFLDIRLHRWNDAALVDAAAMVCYGLFKRALSNGAAAENLALHGSLLSGLSGLASTRPIAELWQLSREIRGDKRLRQLFATATAPEILTCIAAPQWDVFRSHFEDYLEVWGFRYSRELMLTSPTPKENPLPVIRLLQNYSKQEGPGPLEVSEQQARERARATAEVAVRFTPEPWLCWLPLSRAGRFRILVRATQGAICLRERARMKQALLYTRLRHLMLRIGEEFTRRGWLEDRDDVFFLTVHEVLDLSGGASPVEVAREMVRQRREVHLQWTALRPPDSFVLRRGDYWQPDASAAANANDLSEMSLCGSSACGGTVEGNAAVVLDVTEADRVRAGDILVTRQTDPGWATVFFLIKGLVIERGGMLSHGAIIAREYGIPAVVGVPEATTRIRTGDRVRVDGDKGVIEFCRG